MSCPVDSSKCPIGASATLNISSTASQYQKQETWKSFSIRALTNCKLRIAVDQVYDTNMINKLKVKVNALTKAESFYIWTHHEGVMSSQSSIQQIYDGTEFTSEIHDPDEEHWIMYTPKNYKAGEIKISAWVVQEAIEGHEHIDAPSVDPTGNSTATNNTVHTPVE